MGNSSEKKVLLEKIEKKEEENADNWGKRNKKVEKENIGRPIFKKNKKKIKCRERPTYKKPCQVGESKKRFYLKTMKIGANVMTFGDTSLRVAIVAENL